MSSALPCGNAFGDVEQDDVAQFLQAGEMRQRAANHARADERDLVASHAIDPLPKTFPLRNGMLRRWRGSIEKSA